jgi:hypothetical protein
MQQNIWNWSHVQIQGHLGKESNSYRLQGSLKEDSHRDREMSSSLVENESSHIGEDTPPLAAGSLAEDIHYARRGTGTHGHRHSHASCLRRAPCRARPSLLPLSALPTKFKQRFQTVVRKLGTLNMNLYILYRSINRSLNLNSVC